MKIETKFDEGDTIFFLHNKKVLKSVVQGFKVERLPKNGKDHKTEITYLCNSESDQLVNLKVSEQDAYASKEQLLKSL